MRFHYQTLAILNDLQDRNLITFSVLGRGSLVKFRIAHWHRHNRVLDYNAPCQKDTGFFFLPVATATELISYGRCSEMDAMLDMWINTVYNDDQVQGSEIGPVVYFRNCTGSPLVSYSELGQRWGVSKATAGRYLQKLQSLECIDMMSFQGTHGTAIYLRRFLSTMFEISDVLVDKEEVAMALNIRVDLPESNAQVDNLPAEISVSESVAGVSKTYITEILHKVAKVIAAQGFPCCSCPKVQYKLLPLSSECKEAVIVPGDMKKDTQVRFLLTMICQDKREIFRFDVRLEKGDAK